MAKAEKGAIVPVNQENGKFPIATQDDINNFAFINENALAIVRENLGGQDLKPSDFERIKFPSGGATNWEVCGLDGETEAVKTIDGIILMYNITRNFWREEFSGEGSMPDCRSKDLKSGVGNPGGLCATCPYAQWESDPKGGGGQACKVVGTLFVMKPGESLPVVVPVPVASVGPLKKFMLSLASKDIKYSNAILSIGLQPDQNKGGIKYSKLKPRLLAVLPDSAKSQIDSYIKAFRESMEKVTVAREDMQ